MKNTTFNGSLLEEALKKGSLSHPDIELVGMVKSSEKKEHICFTRSGEDRWVDLPINFIKEAEHIGNNTCIGQSHPVMRIILKEPKNPKSQAVATLLQLFTLKTRWPNRQLKKRYSATIRECQ